MIMDFKFLSTALLSLSLMGCHSSSEKPYIKNVEVEVLDKANKVWLPSQKITFDMDGIVLTHQDLFKIGDKTYTTDFRLSKKFLENGALWQYYYPGYQNGSRISEVITKIGDADNLATKTNTSTISGDVTSFKIDYITIDNKSYISEIIETERDGGIFYTLSFDYSNFAAGQIVVKQELYNKPIFEGKLDIIPAGEGQILPDQQLMSLYPLNKHRHLINSGLMGAYDYLITKMVITGEEEYEQTSTFNRDKQGRVLKQAIDHKGKFTYLNFTKEYSYKYTFGSIEDF